MRYSAFGDSKRMSWNEMMIKKQRETGYRIEKETVEYRDKVMAAYASRLISRSSSYVES